MKKINFKAIVSRIVGVGVGTVAGAVANAQLEKMDMFKEDPKKKALALLGVGALLPTLVKAKPGSILENVGDGVLSEGVKQALTAFAPEYAEKWGIAGTNDWERYVSGNAYVAENAYVGLSLEEGEAMQDPETGEMLVLQNGVLVPITPEAVSGNTYQDHLF